MPTRPRPLPRPPTTPHLFQPHVGRPLRAKRLKLLAATEVLPHRHPWAQLTFSRAGAVRMTAAAGTYLVPPSRALWIPPDVEHAVTAVEEAELITLYLHQPRGRCGPGVPAAEQAPWRECRVLEVSDLLRALMLELDATPEDPLRPPPPERLQRDRLLAMVILDELRRARPVRLGVALPRDKRLRVLCQAVLDDPGRHRTLDDWARGSGASSRTIARLFREQLGVSFGQWRQQVFLTRALTLAERGTPMARIAGELGYASASAFTAMVRRTVGQPPSRFFTAG
ncbi:AraC family transcriptional regulator [Aquabacterium sp.]|uniref:AraC family transcriptional regulator n=1 Tax=Aquabacterium sp. TaxID=1872578 RepID=UPI003784143C